MKRRDALLGLAGFAVCLLAKPASAAPRRTAAWWEARLEADTGCAWIVDLDEHGEPRVFCAGGFPRPTAVGGTSREAAAIAFLARHGAAFGAPRIARELELLDERTGFLGGTTLHFVQRIPGSKVRVVDNDLFVDFDGDGALTMLTVGIVRNLSGISPRPSLTPQRAQRRIWPNAHRDEAARVGGSPELVVYRLPDGRGRLAYRGHRGRAVLTVDAHTGRILEELVPSIVQIYAR
jgi:hypothetical protein